MGNDSHLLVDEVAHDLKTVTSTLSTITSLSSSINTISLLGQYIINDAEELKRKSVQLEEMDREIRSVMKRVELRARQLDERMSRLDKQENDLKYREVRLSQAMKRVEEREDRISKKEKEWEEIESSQDTDKRELIKIVKEEAEKKVRQYVDETPSIIKLNVGGEIFTLEKRSIMRFPHSLLALMVKGGRFNGTKEVFVDRDHSFFPKIINVIRGSTRPPIPLFSDEYRFWFQNDITSNPIVTFHNVILAWLPKTFALLYCSGSHGLSISKFHSHCDNKGPTLSIIQSGGYLFGGYNPDQWESPEIPTNKHLPDSFMFTLSNPHNIPPTQYLPQKDTPSICQHTNCGIYFGGSSSADGGLLMQNNDVYIDFPGRNFIDTSGKGREIFTGRGGTNAIDVIFVYSVK